MWIAWLFETFGSIETKMIFKPVKLELVRESKAYFRSLIIFLLHCSVSNEQDKQVVRVRWTKLEKVWYKLNFS